MNKRIKTNTTFSHFLKFYTYSVLKERNDKNEYGNIKSKFKIKF